MGIGADEAGVGGGVDGDGDGDALEDDVRAIFGQEMKRIRREMKMREQAMSAYSATLGEGVDSFEDAVQF